MTETAFPPNTTLLVVMGSNYRGDLIDIVSFEDCKNIESVKFGSKPHTLQRGWVGKIEVKHTLLPVLSEFVFSEEDKRALPPKTRPLCTMYRYVTEMDGSVSTYEYVGVLFQQPKSDDNESTVGDTRKIDFFAWRKSKI